jgi:hypothetical protein
LRDPKLNLRFKNSDILLKNYKELILQVFKERNPKIGFFLDLIEKRNFFVENILITPEFSPYKVHCKTKKLVENKANFLVVWKTKKEINKNYNNFVYNNNKNIQKLTLIN